MCTEQPVVSLTARLKVKDVAEKLQVSKRMVQKYITSGKLKAHLVERKDENGKVTYASYRIFGRDLIKFWNTH